MPTQRGFTAAGWIAIVSAVGSVPMVAVAIAVVFFPENQALQRLDAVLSLLAAVVGIYLLLALKRLLHLRRFHAADLAFAISVGGFAIGAVVDLVGTRLLDPQLAEGLVFAISWVLAVVSAVLGYQILPVANVVGGPLKPFAYLTIASGVTVATILLMPIGLVTSIAANIYLAMVFFREKDASPPVSQTPDALNIDPS